MTTQHPMTSEGGRHPMKEAERAAARERAVRIADALRRRLEALGWSELWSTHPNEDTWHVGGRIADEWFVVKGNSPDGAWYALHARALEVAEVNL